MRERPELLLDAARSREPRDRIVSCATAARALGMPLDKFDRDIRGAPGTGGAGVGLRLASMHAGRPFFDAAYLHARFTELGLWGWRAREAAAREEDRDAAIAAREEARRAREATREAKRKEKEDANAARKGAVGDVPGDVAAAVFAMFEAGTDPVRIVVEARCHPAGVEILRRRYDAMRGGVTLTAGHLAALRAAGVRVDAADGDAAVASIVKAVGAARAARPDLRILRRVVDEDGGEDDERDAG